MFTLYAGEPITTVNKGCGVYRITNKVTGSHYIGSSSKIYSRFRSHLYSLRHNIHNAVYLQNAYNKYGEENFEFRPLLLCEKGYELIYEVLLINAMKWETLYNVRKFTATNKGLKHSSEARAKMSEKHQQRLKDPEYRKRLSEYAQSVWQNPELVELIRLKKTGRKRTQEFKDGQSKRIKEFWQKLKISNPEEYMNRVGNLRKRQGSGTKDPKTGRYTKNV